MKVDDEIAPGATLVCTGPMGVNQFMSADPKVANTPLEKLKTVWERDTYLFKDGTSLKVPPGQS